MKNLAEKIITIFFIVAICLGCKYLDLKQDGEGAKETKTQITKEVLTERLTKKGVKIADSSQNLKPSPNYLLIKMVRAYAPPKLKLNDTELDFPELVMKLNKIFIEREKNGVFVEGTNEGYKRINLSATDSDISFYNKENVSVEDFEKLVDDLRREKFDQIYLTVNEFPTLKLSDLEKPLIPPTNQSSQPPFNTNSAKNPPDMVSGGVVNGKAVNLVKPPYPPAAKAVRAAGAVNVEVVIDEQGNVVSANAISGHPLLRPSAESAARSSKFSPTILSGKPVKIRGVIIYTFLPIE